MRLEPVAVVVLAQVAQEAEGGGVDYQAITYEGLEIRTYVWSDGSRESTADPYAPDWAIPLARSPSLPALHSSCCSVTIGRNRRGSVARRYVAGAA
jgi:hypothetical protein